MNFKAITTAIFTIALSVSGLQAQDNSLNFKDGSPEATFSNSKLNDKLDGLGTLPDGTSSWTCEFWIKVNASSVDAQTPITEGQQSSWGSIGLETSVDNTAKLHFYNSGNIRTTPVGIELGKWEHVTIIVNQAVTSKGQFYLNGVDQGLFSGNMNDAFCLTKLNPGGSLNSLDVEIDEFRVWTGLRTPAQITAAMNSTFTAPYTAEKAAGLQLYYNFNNTNVVGRVDELTGFVDDESNTADSINDTNVFKASNLMTPAYGVITTLDGTNLNWVTDYESGVVSYYVEKLVGSDWVKLTAVAAKGTEAGPASYNVTIDNPAAQYRITTVDASGFTQSHAVESDNIDTTYLNIKSGWNLLSIPATDADITELQAATTGTIWGWDGTSYREVTTPKALQGIWIFADNATEITVTGTKVTETEVTLNEGWSLVGPANNTIAPAGYSIYSWEESYQQILDTDNGLIKGKGYWIYSDSSATINLK